MTTKMSKRDRLLSFLNLFGDESFTYFFLLNLVSNCTYAYTYHPFFAVFLMVCLSGSIALLEMFLFRILSKLGSLGKIYLLTIGTVYTIFILIDYFCLFNFQSTFDQDKLDILQSNRNGFGKPQVHHKQTKSAPFPLRKGLLMPYYARLTFFSQLFSKSNSV